MTWTAATGREAVDRCGADVPDFVLIVLRVTGIDVTDATRRIMSTVPAPFSS